MQKKSDKKLDEINSLISIHEKIILGNTNNIGPDLREKFNIVNLLFNNSNAPVTWGNEIKVLNDGKSFFDALIHSIENAKHHIHLEFYIFENDKIGNRIKDLLIQKRNAGIEVRVIIDDVGSWGLTKKFISGLRKHGIEIFPFMEVRFPRLTSKVNFRNHRKIAIIDGEIAFTGGSNIADRYKEGLKNIGPWRDTNVQIKGNAVFALQEVFADDWYFMTNRKITGPLYFKPVEGQSGIPVQIAISDPFSDWESISQAYFAAISNAKKCIYITTPYLMPPQPLITALKTAALSNVEVKIIIPEKSDAITPKWSTFSYIEELLEAGIRIFLYRNGFIHSKYMIVDDVLATIGTTNFDFRSFETNFEVNAFMFSRDFCDQMNAQFNENIDNSVEINIEAWKNRAWHCKLRESFAHIIAPLM